MTANELFSAPIRAVNIGAELLGEALKAQGVEVVQLDWKPPKEADLSPRLLEILNKME